MVKISSVSPRALMYACGVGDRGFFKILDFPVTGNLKVL